MLLLAALIAGLLWFRPLDAGRFSASAHPVTDYLEGLRRIEDMDTRDGEVLGDYGKSIVLTHGHRTKRVIVLLHGSTLCPKQFEALGLLFYKRGENVLIPRLPHHGLKDRMNDDQSRLKAEELALTADQAVDIAHALGDHIDVMGLSMGGVMTAWLAQHRSDIDCAMLLDPAFGFQAVPNGLGRPAMNLYLSLPNQYSWWDEKLKDRLEPGYAYPRWSSLALAELLRLGYATQEQAARSAPAVRSIWVVTNANDAEVDNRMTADLVASWRRFAPDRVHSYEFPADMKLDHDLIDPGNPQQKTGLVYPKLLALMQP